MHADGRSVAHQSHGTDSIQIACRMTASNAALKSLREMDAQNTEANGKVAKFQKDHDGRKRGTFVREAREKLAILET